MIRALRVLQKLPRACERTRRQKGSGYGDGTGFRVHLPHRESFSPDAACYVGPRTWMRFPEGAPIFVVEVRSENDYGPAAERPCKQNVLIISPVAPWSWGRGFAQPGCH